MQICVTAEDIEQGEPTSPVNCPVARAMIRALGTPVFVGLSYIHQPFHCRLSSFVSAKISKMLDGEHVEPFSFDLGISCK